MRNVANFAGALGSAWAGDEVATRQFTENVETDMDQALEEQARLSEALGRMLGRYAGLTIELDLSSEVAELLGVGN